MVNSPEISLLSKIANYTEILAKDPFSTAFVSLSDVYRQMGLLEDALEVAEKGIKSLPRFCPGYVILGRIQCERGDIPAAVLAFENAYALDNENLPAIKGLARVLVQQKKFVRARQLLRNAVSLAPEDATMQKMLKALPPVSRCANRQEQRVRQGMKIKNRSPLRPLLKFISSRDCRRER